MTARNINWIDVVHHNDGRHDPFIEGVCRYTDLLPSFTCYIHSTENGYEVYVSDVTDDDNSFEPRGLFTLEYAIEFCEKQCLEYINYCKEHDAELEQQRSKRLSRAADMEREFNEIKDTLVFSDGRY